MATSHNAFAADAPHSSEFETRRAALVNDIGESLEQVLTHINALNRSLEGIIEIGNEFASVEALWSQFETVMGREEEVAQDPSTQDDTEESRVEHDRASRG